MVSANHSKNELSVNIEGNGLNRLFNRYLYLFDKVLNGCTFGRFEKFRFVQLFIFGNKRIGNGLFHICRKAAFRTNDYIRFARLGKGHELMTVISADLTRVGQNGAIFNTAFRKDTTVCVIHRFITLNHAFTINVKRVCILHDEFTTAH